jgi:hypothetical protein
MTQDHHVHVKNAFHHAHNSYAKASHVRHNASYAKIAHVPKTKVKNASNGTHMSFHTFDDSYVLTNNSGKLVVKYVGPHHKSPKTCVWVPKVLVIADAQII